MARPPLISRSFPVLTLLMAIPLVAIVAFIAYDRYFKDDGDGWQTYRNERFGYEIRLPTSYQVERDSGGELKPGLSTQHTVYVDRAATDEPIARSSTEPAPKRAPRVTVWVNPQGDWCTSTLGMTTEAIVVGGVRGKEHVCILQGPVADHCTPKPLCTDVPWGVMRDFERDGNRFWIFGDISVATDDNARVNYETVRRVVQSFRFTN